MKKLISLFTIALFLCISINSFAQVASYTFSQASNTYSEITGDTVVAVQTTLSTNPTDLDDAVYATNSIPFTFKFNGTNYTNVQINTNGYVTFGTTSSSATNYTCIASTDAYAGSVGAISRDLVGGFGFRCTRTSASAVLTGVTNFSGIVVGKLLSGTGIPALTTVVSFDVGLKTVTMSLAATSTATGGTATVQCVSGSIVRGTTGPVGARIHTIQWKNFRRFTTTDTLENFNFQIRLYETSNIVDVIYGPVAKSLVTPITPQVGLRGALNSDFNDRTTTTNWSATTAGGTNAVTCTMSNAIVPANGLTFIWTPPAAPVINDVGVSAISVGAPAQIISPGKGYNLTATVKNYGSATQTVIPVYYDVNGGSPVGPVNTVGPIINGGTENVVFNGGFNIIPVVGLNTIRAWTVLASDQHPSANDTFTVVINVAAKIASYPYVETFTTAPNWTVVVEKTVGTTGLWGLASARNPDGVAADLAARSNFFNGSSGRVEILRSPEMDISSLTNPTLDFYVAYRTYTGGENDSLQVVLSTDGGLTYFSASTSYNKGDSSLPSLGTRPGQSAAFVPDSSIQWRHETISLANVAGSSNIVIGFRAKSNFGNMLYIDNVIVNGTSSLCTDAVSGPGTYNCNTLVTLDFTATPAPQENGVVTPVQTRSVRKEIISDNNTRSFPTQEGKINVISANPTDNPTGGVAFVSQYTNNDPGQTVAPNVGFTNATPPTGPAFDPTFVYNDYWFTVTYTGNDKTGYATYNIKIDLDGLVFTDPTKLYVVKRTDRTGSWVCQNTTISGNALVVTGLTDFSDFALAGAEALPVELASFVSSVNGNNVNLNWATASELNNSGFDVERSLNGTWSKVGNVAGNGTTTNGHNYSFTDRNLAAGNYSYRLKQIDFNGNFEYFNLSSEVNVGIPAKFELSQNYPNPFNPSTKISYALPNDGNVSLKIYDMSGKEVMTLVNEVKTAGYYSVNFNASSLSSGIYFYTISANNITATKKMMLIK